MRQEMLVEVLERGLRELKIERALARYVAGGVSFAAAAQLAGLTREDLTRQAYARGVQPAYSEQTVEEELG
jgi:predicted HTH domain antitoxin